MLNNELIKELIEVNNEIKKKEDNLDKLKKNRQTLMKSVIKNMAENKQYSVTAGNNTLTITTKYTLTPMEAQRQRLMKNLCINGYKELITNRIDEIALSKEFNNSMLNFDKDGNLVIPDFIKGLVSVSEYNYINITQAAAKGKKKDVD